MRDLATGRPRLATLAFTAAAMLAFAANSLLCRLALLQGGIDPASFGAVRIVSGAIALALIVRWRAGGAKEAGGDWLSAAMLFAYVALFSFAYVNLAAGTGALILFGAVQLTMFGAALRAGERFAPLACAGLAVAALGLVYLVLPGVSAPPIVRALLMALAGVAWGVYSLRGRGALDPLGATAGNFLRAAPMALVLWMPFVGVAHADVGGILLAVASGAITSGVGYALWYTALRELSAMRAATVQLSVPVITAFGAVLFLAEPLSLRLVLASVAILGGIALVLAGRAKQ
ncbi:DMT family transporter [Massilia sp. IC2-278]|uniref:DMT family transporter n=1 Tax=Massilia sp. IC2-278 TaxID=2887200 RepID=UPI001E2DA31F|nr:DMT family transporter [Massilia sp. IC2-278]MCC2961532.1 DMT family transporter [Massilia sp. IC2-278]